MHNGNVAFMTFEVIFNKLEFEFSHCGWGSLYMLSYLLFAVYLHQRTGKWIYFFVDYDMKYSYIIYPVVTTIYTVFHFMGIFLTQYLLHLEDVNWYANKSHWVSFSLFYF